MRAGAVDSTNSRNNSCFLTMAKGAVVGSAAGYALKYIQPITRAEKADPIYRTVVGDIQKRGQTFNIHTREYVADLKAKKNKSLAEDTFVKMFSEMKEGDKFGADYTKLFRSVRKLQKENPGEVKEFLNLCKNSRKLAKEITQKSIKGYNLVTKSLRPTSFFVGAGAITGALIGLFANILHTEVKES